MIYAIILIIIGLVAIIFNKEAISKRAANVKAWIAPLFMLYGVVGIIFLTTIRFNVMSKNPTYWYSLIVGSALAIIIGIFFINRYSKLKKDPLPNRQMYLYQNMLGYIAVIIGILTIFLE